MLKIKTGVVKFIIFTVNTVGKEKTLGVYEDKKRANQWFRFFVKQYGVGNVFMEEE